MQGNKRLSFILRLLKNAIVAIITSAPSRLKVKFGVFHRGRFPKGRKSRVKVARI